MTSPPESTPSRNLFTNPWMLALTWVLPQGVLLALNLSALDLVRGDLSPEQGSRFLTMLFLEGGLLALGAATAGWLIWRRKDLPWLWNLPGLLLSIGYLWGSTFWITNGLLPDEVRIWMLPEGRLLFYQFTFIMPAIFYTALRMACFPLPVHKGLDFGVTALVTLGVPVGWYLFMFLVRGILDSRLFNASEEVLLVMLVGSTVILCLGMLRLLNLGWSLLRRSGETGFVIVAALVGIVMPILGLLLNISIPFPANFQTPAVYVLAVLNGVVLLWPAPKRLRMRSLLWLLRCFMFPFTLYFFLVFLPFLPLAVPAILAVGTGFLMLTPTILFIVHGRRLLEGWIPAREAWGSLVAVVLALLCCAIMPAVYTGRAVMHRTVIHEALAYAYDADPGRETEFEGRRGFLRIALHNLRDRREGVELPFLSHYYHAVVFKGLVLPDAKMQYLYQFYFGEELPPSPVKGSLLGSFAGQRGLMSSNFRVNDTPPPRDVELAALRSEVRREDDLESTLVKLSLKNRSSQQSEYQTRVHLPEGIFVSGFWLHIGEERVPGRLFEKKTALWVYRMIRDATRRDPGLLYYEDPRTLSLSVFPFENHQERTVEIEFLYPRGTEAVVTIGDRELALGQAPERDDAHVLFREGEGAYVRISGHTLPTLPAFQRSPILHLVVDHSADSEWEPSNLREGLTALQALVPEVEQVQVTFANFESVDAYDHPQPIGEVLKNFPKPTLSRAGGFCRQRAVEGILSRHAGQSEPERFSTYPLIAVLQAVGTEPVQEPGHGLTSTISPDRDSGLVVIPGEAPRWWSFGPEASTGSDGPHHRVLLVRVGDHHRALRVDNPPVDVALSIPGRVESDARVEVYHPETKAFAALPSRRLRADSRYGEGASAWFKQALLDRRQGPPIQTRRELVVASREAGVLVPATSYIVVESHAQWEMLERKEKQKLSESDALDFMNTPEPSTLLLLLLAGGGAWLHRRRRTGLPR